MRNKATRMGSFVDGYSLHFKDLLQFFYGNWRAPYLVCLFRGHFAYPNARPAFYSMIPGPSILGKKTIKEIKIATGLYAW